MIWVAFGGRKAISFPIEPVLKKHSIEFLHDRATLVDPDKNVVETEKNGSVSYDYLIVASGCSMKFDGIPGFDKGYTECIVTPGKANGHCRPSVAVPISVYTSSKVYVLTTSQVGCPSLHRNA